MIRICDHLHTEPPRLILSLHASIVSVHSPLWWHLTFYSYRILTLIRIWIRIRLLTLTRIWLFTTMRIRIPEMMRIQIRNTGYRYGTPVSVGTMSLLDWRVPDNRVEGAWDAATIHHQCAIPNPGRPATRKHVPKTIAPLFKSWAATKRAELTMLQLKDVGIQSLSLIISAKVYEKTSI